MNLYSLLAVLLLTVITTNAQVRVSRSWFTDIGRRASPQGAIASLTGGAEVFRSTGSLQNEQAWQIRMHAVAEPYRFTDSTSAIQWTTSLSLHHELTASPYSTIGFNPRTARWEEQVRVHMSAPSYSLNAGWVHRCKHDIDNLEGPRDGATIVLVPEQRTVILTGPTLGAATAPFSMIGGTGILAASTEWYVVSEDYRRPTSKNTGLLSDVTGAVQLRGEWSIPLSAVLAIRSTLWTSIPWFAARHGAPNNGVPFDARAELALSVNGAAARMDVAIAIERQFDELVFLTGLPTSLIQFGVRFAPR